MQTLMVFLEGTAFNTKPLALCSARHAYTPIGGAVQKINSWHGQYTVVLCTYRRMRTGLVRRALRQYGVQYDVLEHRRRGEQYADVVLRVHPDILVEDDCRSIGGAAEMCVTKLPPQERDRIRSIVVPEFRGIDGVMLE